MFDSLAARHPRTAFVMRRATAIAAARSAWLIGALFLWAGWAVLDDYTVIDDSEMQRETAAITLDYILGRSDALLNHPDRIYGVVFDLPLLLLERLLDLQDSRALYRMRHGLTHLVFLAGGLGCYALTYRLYGRRPLALGAMGLFLLHPRLCAHAFFNSKDIPFLSLFMLALLLIHWAGRRGSVAAFLLCGLGVGALTNLRPMGILLFGAVLALRAGDAVYAERGARRAILRTSGAFVLASALTSYALLPYLWADPAPRFVETVAHGVERPDDFPLLFRGRPIQSSALPLAYAPVWFAISTPPLALGLGCLGSAAVVRRLWRPRGAGLRGARFRFQLLLLACFVLPVLAVMWLQAEIYNGWRHLYFIYAPFCLLAADGLYALAAARRRLGRPRARGPGERKPGRTLALSGRPRAGAWGLALLALIGVAASLGPLAALHPHQSVYLNFLAARAAPVLPFSLSYASARDGLRFLLARYPDRPLRLYAYWPASALTLPADLRQRLAFDDFAQADFALQLSTVDWRAVPLEEPYAPVLYTDEVYGYPLIWVTALNLARVPDAVAAPYRAAYRDLQTRVPIVRAPFNVYLDRDARVASWVKQPCRAGDASPKFILHVTPADLQALPPHRRRYRFDNRDFLFFERGVRVDDACLAVVPLPAYPIRHLTVGQWHSGAEAGIWTADYLLPPPPDRVNDYRAAYRALTAQPPTHRDVFDAYLTRSRVTFVQTPCREETAQAWLRVRIEPFDARQPGARQLDFDFFERGVRVDDACLASAPLPAPLRRVTVGQEAEDTLWEAAFTWPLPPAVAQTYRAAYARLTTGAPALRAAFDVYVTADAVAYAKAPCAAADTAPKFILHVVPVRRRDLPPDRRRAGFDNRDFEFAWQGAHFEGRCLARAALPAYPIARLRVGQFRTGEDPLWLAELPPAP